jgi:hypothetical protein
MAVAHLDKRDIYVSGTRHTCKFCGKPSALRSHRKNYFEFLRTRWTGMVPFRCGACKRRFWDLIDSRDI